MPEKPDQLIDPELQAHDDGSNTNGVGVSPQLLSVPYQSQQPPQSPGPQQPGQFYPPQGGPPMQPVQSPRKKKLPGCVVALLVVMGILFAVGIAQAIVNPQANTKSSSNPSSSSSSSSSDNGSQATTVPVSQPTQPPASPTPTPKPTPTPTLTQQIQSQTLDLANNALHGGIDLKSTYDKGSKQVTIQENINDGFNNAQVLEQIKIDCFYIQQAIWKAKIARVDTVEVYIISNSLVDQYGNTSTGPLAHCILGKNTAALFNWDNLDQDQAWGDYEDTWYLPSLNNNG